MQPIKSKFCNGRIIKILAVSALILPGILPASNFTGTANADCASPAFTTSSTNGGWSNGGYYVHNNMWNVSGYQVAETLYACAFNNWYVRANMNNNNHDGAVKTYPNVHKDYSKARIDSFSTITSTFAETAPHGAGIIYDVSYDLWTNGSNGTASSGSNEFMIWTENYNQMPSGTKQATVTLGGRTYDVWKTSSNSYIAFVPTVVFTSGTVDLLEIFKWTMNQGWIPSNSWIDQLDFGIEFVSTNNNTVTFTCTDFSLTTATGTVGAVKKAPLSAVTKLPIVKNEYYSLSGIRLEHGTAGAAKNRLVINRAIDANGVVHSAVMVTR